MIKVFLIAILLFMTGCHKKDCEFSNFSIKLNANNCFEDKYGLEGYVIASNGDTINFLFGFAIWELTEKDPTVIYIPLDEDDIYNDFDTTKFKLADRPDFDIDRFRKQNVFFVDIDEFEAKLTRPRRTRDGITGVYIDSIHHNVLMGDLRFHMYGKNLSKETESQIVEAFKTIKFKRDEIEKSLTP